MNIKSYIIINDYMWLLLFYIKCIFLEINEKRNILIRIDLS